ncbi:SPOR domain-containing protein [Geobacter argillaceus]|uniref:Sporulation related protein n=1 Tax=Geobacter argillaceus TaxID=345631 RepID=A0A562VGQ6_9BACT|nr:SPOR domain-containing protein [Geobacter argillaceus]TWJ17062.1 sporulation related protein [Geobacter argillaceus]
MIFANQPDDSEKGAGGRNQKPLLLVLLVLVAVFAYLYFFTGLIKPRQEEQPAPPPVAEVKKPLPPRPDGERGQPAKIAVKAPEAAPKAVPAEQKTKAGEPAAARVKPQPVQTPAQAANAPEKAAPAKAVAQLAKETAKPAPAGNEATKPAPAAVGSGKAKAPQQQASGEKVPKADRGAVKPAPATADKTAKKDAVAAVAKKDVAGKKAGKEPVKKAAGAVKTATVTLLVGEFVPDRDFLALQTRLKNMGLSPLHKTELKKAKPMNRLYVGEYPDYDAGAAELERIKKLSADAFFIETGGTYRVYAGSYYGRRLAEQVRTGLAGKGVATTLQKADVPVTVVRLTAGRFADKAAAAGTIKKLKAAGLAPTVVPLAR